MMYVVENFNNWNSSSAKHALPFGLLSDTQGVQERGYIQRVPKKKLFYFVFFFLSLFLFLLMIYGCPSPECAVLENVNIKAEK